MLILAVIILCVLIAEEYRHTTQERNLKIEINMLNQKILDLGKGYDELPKYIKDEEGNTYMKTYDNWGQASYIKV